LANPLGPDCNQSKLFPEGAMAQHGGFIVAAYLVTGTILIGVIAAVLFDYQRQMHALARLAPSRLGNHS
jgi:heme exporter protein CcmD